jgi:hypothetical protein
MMVLMRRLKIIDIFLAKNKFTAKKYYLDYNLLNSY